MLKNPRKIIHIDMDAFYVAVEMRDNPALQGFPLAVGGSPNARGVIATASYAARKCGVKSAMPAWKALKLCPDLVLLPPRFDRYKQVSRHLHTIYKRFTDVFEPLSLDEAYLDVTGRPHCSGSATLMATAICQLIFTETGLTASAGIAPNKFLAKVASEWNKPNGQFVILPADVPDFVKNLPIESLFGVGKVTSEKMHRLHIFTCADLQQWTIGQLEQQFGSRAHILYQFCRGIDERPVESTWIRKSLSVEDTFPEDLCSLEACFQQVPDLLAKFIKRYMAISEHYGITKLFAKVKFLDFASTTVESSLYTQPSLANFCALVETGWQRRKVPVRLLGIGAGLQFGQNPQLTFW